MINTYEDAVAWLYGRVNYERLGSNQYGASDFKLERMRRLLEALGNPQDRIPAVHIAGTKGKGTTAALVAAIAQEAGYKVGLFTSPHMNNIEERFVVNGQMVSTLRFIGLVQRMADYVDSLPESASGMMPTFFEFITAIAWQHFTEEQVDLVVLEVGLGGRLDSTNLCSPLVSAISSISLDHTRLLGSTVEQIAAEKAGIIKRGVPVVTSAETPAVRELFRNKARDLDCPYTELHTDFAFDVESPWTEAERQQKLVFYPLSEAGREGAEERLEVVFRKPGRVYGNNIALALGCIRELRKRGYTFNTEATQKAVRDIALPLRFEILQDRPLLIADAAHNPSSFENLITTVHAVFPGRPVTFLVAVSKDKDYATMCRSIPDTDRVIVTQYGGNERGLPAAQLLGCLRESHRGESLTFADPRTALAEALQSTPAEGVVVATGSLFLAAEIRTLVCPEQVCRQLSTQVA
ncbi:bifunctional folylpolyglutamate synthase/dihydrofolate synthase [Rubinisphaera margarita]|uniref:bifunctional folylpolyglutamate synthase/dihydrofolate synthase n=1 Tax=Rubinisphaera margarita TaxID=2909586 RepID=UPI001EE87FB6|nr:folylpolyglutamate synthase/dihydrofolate synthase family protein [Rubinisphaera margarita]MCG6156075.1 bifunctional folylpolyglutamate synthase/dihydrofolate synthase [Rubinisphaera margarita]